MSEKPSATTKAEVFSDPMAATPEVQQIATQVRAEFEKEAHMTCAIFKALIYRYQKVDGLIPGTNYLIKVQVSNNAYVHLKVFQSPPAAGQDPTLINFQTGKTVNEPLNNF